jgi:hypothetical protein
MIAHRIRYRFNQFLSLVLGSFHSVDIDYVKTKLLSADLLELFMRMPRLEQNHAVAVCKTLEQRGVHSPDLLSAALLHDVGKVEYFPRIWERVLTVLIGHITPKLASKLAQGMPKGLRRGFVIHNCHAEWGADLARSAGASARTVYLINKHHSNPGEDIELAALQVVDDG